MHIAIERLGLNHLFAVYPGNISYAISENIEALATSNLDARLHSLTHGME